MNKSISRFMLTIAFGILISCSSNSSNKTGTDSDTIPDSLKRADSLVIVDGGIPIFYNMYLSVEMSTLFQSIGATYNPEILNIPDKTEMYEVSTDKALNLGVYAVDLSYCKYFDQFNQAGKYLKNMQKLSEEMGIPSEKFYLSLKRIEVNLTNKDSLIKIANDIYKTTEDYLKLNDRGSAAALVIAGGWVEAMYIATGLIKKDGAELELMERIAEQKQSVTDLLSLLVKYNKEPVIKDMIIKFTDIKGSLDNLVVDDAKLGQSFAGIMEVKAKIFSLRKEMVN